MDDAATRATALATARSLLLREGDKFTVASLCRETKLSRARLRRVFPTKAALTAAVLNELLAESKLGQGSANSAAPSNRDSIAAVGPGNTVAASDDLSDGIEANNVQPRATTFEDDWMECRFRVVERAIAALDARVETRCGEQSESIALLEQKLVDIVDVPVGPSPVVELPPLIGEQAQQEADVDIIDESEFTPVALPLLEPLPPPAVNIPLGRSPSRLQMLAILENAVRSQGDATPAWRRHRADTNLRIGLVEIAAATFAGLLTIAGLFWAHDHARATESPAAAKRQAQEPISVALIDATGIPKLHANEGAPNSPGLVAQADGGSLIAQTALAQAFLRGAGEERDSLAAARWSLVAAQHGEPSAQFILGSLYFDGIKPDPRLAIKWFYAAASRGNVKAMHNLGVAFLSGRGVARDPATAVSWFSRAANLGYRDSAFDLAVLYERGEGVSQNPGEALRWYDKASYEGDQEATQRASFLRSNLSYVAKK